MTDPNGYGWQVYPRNASSWNDICNNEAQSYGYRINGYLVQSFWSQSDGAYAVYDGNSQNMYVNNGVLNIYGISSAMMTPSPSTRTSPAASMSI
jgi:hypothetical protein